MADDFDWFYPDFSYIYEPTNYKTLMQTSQSASDTYKATLAAIANIYADASIDAAGKAKVINGYLGWMKQNMNMIGSVNGVDLTGLTDFGSVNA